VVSTGSGLMSHKVRVKNINRTISKMNKLSGKMKPKHIRFRVEHDDFLGSPIIWDYFDEDDECRHMTGTIQDGKYYQQAVGTMYTMDELKLIIIAIERYLRKQS
jgi:hypothetical protein